MRFLAPVIFAGALAGCVTDGMIGAEVDEAKPRVIDTAKTRNTKKKDADKQSAAKSEPASRTAARTPATAQGDGAAQIVTARAEPAPKEAETAVQPKPEGTVIPARTLFGNWTLGQEGGGSPCKLILGGVPIGTAYAARGEADCPKAFTTVQTWEIQGDELVLRNGSRNIVGRLHPTGPSRFDGKGDGGAPVYLMR
ncbi:MAG TPA: AprI/Inh family metalloprotease inhibitor [Xanthobacteraceae bacterium]|nr:AprI/Inh family metalloprotease inhibitor [Xanthobacteraceae bacterium]